jgi:proline racemase
MGTVLKAWATDRREIDGVAAVVPVIDGSASITGFHEFVSED